MQQKWLIQSSNCLYQTSVQENVSSTIESTYNLFYYGNRFQVEVLKSTFNYKIKIKQVLIKYIYPEMVKNIKC